MNGPGLSARAIDAVIDRGVLPDAVLRGAIRQLLRRRLAAEDPGTAAGRAAQKAARLQEWSHAPVALSTDEANEQHYEVPTELFELMLGPRLKYSSAYWPEGVTTLDQAEDAMLRLTCERADLQDGQDVLELGCGWGSLTLWMAERYPRSTITAVSNSATQRALIEKRAAERGLDNVTVLTRDVNDLEVPPASVDRVVSVEMFEHVRNHAELLRRIAGWLRPGGVLFVHVFAHRELLYPFDVGGDAGRRRRGAKRARTARMDWMARHFFTDGVMPSHDMFLHLQRDLVVDRLWAVDGTHYSRTLEAWLDRLDDHRDRVLQLLGDTYGADRAEAWYHRWRVFTLACSELFAYDGGTEWHVTHARMRRR